MRRLLVIGVLGLAATLAKASPVLFTFNTPNGSTVTGEARGVTGIFDGMSATTFTVTLDNTLGSIKDVGQLLTELQFAGANGPITANPPYNPFLEGAGESVTSVPTFTFTSSSLPVDGIDPFSRVIFSLRRVPGVDFPVVGGAGPGGGQTPDVKTFVLVVRGGGQTPDVKTFVLVGIGLIGLTGHRHVRG